MASLPSTRPPEVTSKTATSGDEVNDKVKNLIEIVCCSFEWWCKDDWVKQRAKVAEEAVAGCLRKEMYT